MKFTKQRAFVVACLLLGAAILGYPLARAASPIQLGGSIWPLTLISIPDLNPTDAFNQMEQLIAAQAMPGTQLNATFQSQYNGNPLLQDDVVNLPVAAVNAAGGNLFLSGSAGTTIYPGLPIVMVQGTAAGATSLEVLCSPSNTAIATFPIAQLVSGAPVIPLSGGGTNPTTGVALTKGCAAGDSVDASAVGASLTTTTNVFINLPYTIQSSR